MVSSTKNQPQTKIMDTPQRREWRERIRANDLFQKARLLKESAKLIAENKERSALVCGPSGCGKTFAYKSVFKEHGVKWEPVRYASVPGLIDRLKHAKNDEVLVYDDADDIFSSESGLNILKMALDTNSGKKMIAHDVKGSKPFEFKGRIVFLSNKNLMTYEGFPKSMHVHLDALTSRVPPLAMTFDDMAVWEYSVYLAICTDMLLKRHFSLAVCNDAIRYFTEHVNRLKVLSPRSIEVIAERRHNSPETWRERLEMTLAATDQRKLIIRDVPQIIPPSQFPKAA